MSRIGITLDEVLRDFIGRLKSVYGKYYNIDLEDTDIDDFDLLKFLKFKDEKELNEFLYVEAPMEIFAMADQAENNIMPKLNRFIDDINDFEEHEVTIISRDAHKARPSTLFFLSKLGFTGNSIRFLNDTSKMWDYVDILVTANPIALKTKPEGKTSVKINSSYNKEIEADFELDNIFQFIEDEKKFKEITND